MTSLCKKRRQKKIMGIFLRRGGGRGGLPNSYNHLSLHSLFENSEKCNAGKIPIKFLRGVPNPLQMLYWYPRAQQIMIQCAEEQKNFKIRIPNIMKFEITLLIRHS